MAGKIFVFLSVLATLSGAPVQAARPNVLLIVSEDNGPELSCYGDPCARTPNLDQLAQDGVRFQHAFVPSSVCSPSRACFLTGLYPHENGQVGLATHTNDDMKYRHQQNFRWSYVRDFHTWRQQIKKPETDAPSR